jgi:hypothetical protein
MILKKYYRKTFSPFSLIILINLANEFVVYDFDLPKPSLLKLFIL